jgi:hypothetical protein
MAGGAKRDTVNHDVEPTRRVPNAAAPPHNSSADPRGCTATWQESARQTLTYSNIVDITWSSGGHPMQIIDDWLATHPEARIDKAELFGRTVDEVDDLPLTNPAYVVDYFEALSRRVAEYGAPDAVQNEFNVLLETVRRNVRRLKDPNGYLRKTLASLSGTRDRRDVGLILRGALPHARTDEDYGLVVRMAQAIEKTEPEELGIIGGGQWIWCAVGCVVCEAACLACCTLML